jgi:hypothetical protein
MSDNTHRSFCFTCRQDFYSESAARTCPECKALRQRDYRKRAKSRSTTGFIYALRDPLTLEIRYVGLTIHKPTARLMGHLSKARTKPVSNRPKTDWINSLVSDGNIPIIEILEEPEREIMKEREIYWIQKKIDEGCNLLNVKLVHP